MYRKFKSLSSPLVVVVLLATTVFVSHSSAATPSIPVVLDTDIGTDIDDAFALAMVVQNKQLDLKAVTTVSGDTQARARIAAKMLAAVGLGNIPVAAGEPDSKPAFAQAKWADGFSSPSLVTEGAVDLLKDCIQREHGRLVIIAIGPLSNIAALLKRYPEEKLRIHEIVLMGGSIAHGYETGSGPTAEYNIAADAASARVVFESGVPIHMAPLDVTARLQLEQTEREAIFARHTPLTESLHALYVLWAQPTPTLHDPMAVSLLTNSALCKTKRLRIQIEKDGSTKKAAGAPNAEVALKTTPAKFIAYYESFFTH
jgi:inosine-uridine nucleoside N-ribohydrolase